MINILKNYSKVLKAYLIRLERPTSTVGNPVYLYYTDFSRDITYKGIEYKTNVVSSVKNIKFTKDLTAHKVKVAMSGLDQEQLDLALDDGGSSFLNKTLRITILYMDPSTEEVLGDEIVLFEGLITGASISDNATGLKNTSIIEWECANHFQDFQQVVGRITDDAAHRGLTVENGTWMPSAATKRPEYAADKGFFHANKTTNILAQYQTEETKYKLNKKSSWFGIKKSYSMQEYTEIVTKEVDIRFDLSAKFIPVVYGVQKVPAIPIFADTEKNDPSSVWVVYAICEGEIEGFYDFYLDDAPIICTNDTDDEQRVCFGRKKVRGDTLNNSVVPGVANRDAPSEHGREYILDDGQGEIRFWTYHGKSNQSAAQVLVDKAATGGFYLQSLNSMGPEYWDSTFKLLDTAYVIFNYKLSDLEGGRTSIPSLEAEVCGKIVDTVQGGQVIPGTKTSTNMAWQIFDYLRSFRYGMSLGANDFLLSSLEDVAAKFDILDTSYEQDWVPFWRYIGWEDPRISGNENRHIMQTNCIIPTEQTIHKNIGSMLGQVLGSLIKYSGKYILQVESDDDPVYHIDLDKEAKSTVKVDDITGSSKYNTVNASIADPGKSWQTTSITFYNSKFKAEDRGVEKKLNLSFPYITNYYTARSLTERELRKSRSAKNVSVTLPHYYIGAILPNNNVTLTYSRYSWVNKEFLVNSIEIDSSGNIRSTFREYPKDVFINSGQADISNEQDTNIEPAVLPVRDIQYTPSSLLEEPGENVNGQLSWLPSLSQDVDYYLIFWEGSEGADRIPKPSTEGRVNYNIVNLPIGTYTFGIRAVSIRGSFSAPRYITIDVDPSSYLPSVPNFRVVNLEPGYTDRFINNFVQLAWDPIGTTVTDLKYRLQILDTFDNIIREELITAPANSYIYTFINNKADYLNKNNSMGIFRELRFNIRAEGAGNSISANWSKIL